MWQFEPPVLMDIPERIVEIDAGQHISWAISESGNLWMWPASPSGQVGWFYMVASVVWEDFVEIYGIDESEIFCLINPWGHLTDDARDAFSAFLWDEDRAVAAFQIATAPRMVKENVSIVSGGSNHTLLVTIDGDLWAMGDNHLGQLGNGTVEYSYDFINITAMEWDSSWQSPEAPSSWEPWIIRSWE